ncbi:MAG TPA: AMP-binding protein [Acidimicrobiales bacterium]|nr:AMP-binding protein [Acidimicrobiales bacterium]
MNLAEIIADHPADSVALISRGKDTTYGVLRDQVGRLRGGLVARGIEPGDRVAIVAANNWYFVASWLAVLGVGAVAVPLNPTSPGPELTRQLAEVGVSAVFVGPTAKRILPDIDRSAVPELRLVVQCDGGEPAAPGAACIDDLLASEPVPVVPRNDDDLAVLMFTSGTAGFPRAAMLSHGNLLANLEQIQANPFRQQTADDVALGVLPFFHIFGLNVVLAMTLRTGGAVLAVERFDPESALESIKRHGVTLIAGAPAMWSAWAHLPGAAADAFAGVRIAGSGASKLDAEVREIVRTRFGLQIDEGYGLTEASPVVTTSTGIPAPPGSIGAPLPGVKVRLIDADGLDVLVGDVGEIRVQGPNVFQGYWDDAEATARALTPDGWLCTGDLAVVDDDGFLFVVDRLKDLIIVSGFNVYPAEVEAILVEHPGVAAAAVVGVQHPHSGEAVKAYVVAAEGASIEEDDIITFCEERLARYKCPQKVWFVDELPAGLGGKIRKHELR